MSPKMKKGKELLRGRPGAKGIAVGRVRIINGDPERMALFQAGEIYVADFPVPTDPPYMKKAGGMVTNKGGKTTHGVIIGMMEGFPVVPGTGVGTSHLKDGQLVVVDGDEGIIYEAVPVEAGEAGISYEEKVEAPPSPAPSLHPLAEAAKKKGIQLDPEFLAKLEKLKGGR